MVNAKRGDKSLVIDILSQAFMENKSVNYVVKQDSKREDRIKDLMAYSFNLCYSFGNVFLSDDKNACALVIFPDQKRTTAKSILWDVTLITGCIGLSGIAKALSREKKIKVLQPKETLYYLWFIGVSPEAQNRGIGSALLKEIVHDADRSDRTLCLETSTKKNIPWYQKFGFTIYNELDLGYKLYFLKK